MWVARDLNQDSQYSTEDGCVHIFYDKPRRYKTYWVGDMLSKRNIGELFPEIKWEDDPIEVEIIKKLYRVEDVCIGCHNDKCDECYYKDKFKK